MRIFLDTEFTQLTQQAELLSLALIDNTGRTFYAEFLPQHGKTLGQWQQAHVLPHTRWLCNPAAQPETYTTENGLWLFATPENITAALTGWLAAYDDVEMWADCPAYDWVLFCELFGGSMQLPQPLSYIVHDLATLLHSHGIDPLASRASLLPPAARPTGQLHHALYDAQLVRACVQHFAPLKPADSPLE